MTPSNISRSKDTNIFLLGLSFFLVITAFQTMGNIQTVVIESAKTPNTTAYVEGFDGNGFYSLAILYSTISVFNVLAPLVIALIGVKYTMLVGSTTYAAYVATFFHLSNGLLYGGSALLGVGGALLWTAQGVFITINSEPETISRNSGFFWAMLQCSMVAGNTFVFFKFKGKTVIDLETRLTIVVVLTSIAALGTVSFLFLRPTPWVDSKTLKDRRASTAQRKGQKEKYSPMAAMRKSLALLKNPEMLQLLLFFVYMGLELSFWSGVYGPSLGFTQSFPDPKSLTGLNGTFIGLGGIVSGLLFGIFGRFTVTRGRFPVVILGTLVQFAAYLLICLNLPGEAPFGETDSLALIRPSSAPVAIACSLMLGFGDACYNTQIISLLGVLFRDNSPAAFAIFKFFKCIATASCFLYSGSVPLTYQCGILVFWGTVGTIAFARVELGSRKKAGLSKPEHTVSDKPLG